MRRYPRETTQSTTTSRLMKVQLVLLMTLNRPSLVYRGETILDLITRGLTVSIVRAVTTRKAFE